jgi:beta-lactamase regulating signal transducer with metallopeptidase domain
MILAVVDHLWQSTLFSLVVALLVLTMRRNTANARFYLWLAASLKFLIPLSLFIGLGKQLGWTALSGSPQWTLVISDIARPSSIFPVSSATQSNMTILSYGQYIVMAVWAIGFVAVVTRWAVRWNGIKAAVRTATPVNLGVPIDTRYSTTVLEPGVMGIRNPILLLPKDIETHLTPAQLRGVLEHELCHVRRRDNLTSAVHMVVEALFWFYPLVWWLGARLIEERERACDEDVVRRGNDPQIYAEGILRLCKAYIGSPLVCTSGVSGGDLTKRIESIMANRIMANLSVAKKVLLGFACAPALLGPVVAGLLDSQPARAQSKISQLPSRVKLADSAIRISADKAQESGDVVRYTGNVIVEIVGHELPVTINSLKMSVLPRDSVAEGDIGFDGKLSDGAPIRGRERKSALLEGNVRIELDGRTLTTERAVMSARAIKMEMVEVVPTSTGPVLH